LGEALLALSALASMLEGQQENPNRACERDKYTQADFDEQVFVR
jgi:hypothetical protein